jgi:hypothetical protein
VPCPECGAAVEVFKDEPKRRCHQCGHSFQNPGIDFGCAQWCGLAEQCLGLAPDRDATGSPGQGAIAGQLLQYVTEALKAEPERVAHVLKAYHRARQLVVEEGGDPRRAMAATLLLELARTAPAEPGLAEGPGPRMARDVLGRVGADQPTIEAVGQIVGHVLAGRPADSVELKIVRDADALARLTTQYRPDQREAIEQMIQTQLITEGAKRQARIWVDIVNTGMGSTDHGKGQ